ncbi:MAG: putative regulator of Ras-like GTPase activity (Roadblock/LC7/MglB family) [Planctomycetota bacterium]|jgi:predicted regulator of Ras-like GTPase activity (Roadblock/LC7/MglB family)
MAKLDDILREMTETVSGSLACAVVDLNTGLLLGMSSKVPFFTEEFFDVVAAAAVDMFRGKSIKGIESLMTMQSGREVTKTIKEVQMSSDRTYHFMTTLPDKKDALLVLITDRSTNLGMGWMKLRSTAPKVSPFCP